ncbi:MAG: mechanosensitive ion channel family protein [Acidimicrobiia bacterium]|nr:mechanosensitive ion channel family protein [Acidimicrobiia bacterium]
MTALATSVLFSLPAQAPVDPLEEACGPPGEQSWLCSTVFRLTDNQDAAEVADALSSPLKILAILVVAYLLTRVVRLVVRRLVRRLQHEDTLEKLRKVRERTGLALLDTGPQPAIVAARQAQRAENIGRLVRSALTVLIWWIAIFAVLDELGVNLGPLLAGAGVAGVALGFGAQSLVRDFLAGTFMMLEDQFGIGDVIDAGDATGTVESVTLRITRVRDVEGIVWHIPNGEIRRVGNMSQGWSRALLDISVGYGTDIPTASRVIKEVADAMWRDPAYAGVILSEPEVWGVQELGADGIVIRLVVKTAPLEQWAVGRELRGRLKVAFDEAGIEIPFPQRTVWFRNADGTPAGEPGDGGEPAGGAGDRR